MSSSSPPLGYGLYFIDVLACLLFCLTLALVGARFGVETTIPIDLPDTDASPTSGSDVSAPSISLRAEQGETRIYLEGEPVTLEALAARLETDPPPSVVVRSEESTLARVIAVANEAGVLDIQLAYEVQPSAGGRP